MEPNRKTIGRYWRQYQAAQRDLENDPADTLRKEALTVPPTYQSENRKPNKYTLEIDQRVEAIKDQMVFKTPPSRAVNEAKNQVQEYNVIHQVRKVTNK
ncbi:hypothetical protein [Enterococcus sp. 5H]|uniref:hypothetical protein n=1 Tax=Enterococcus sp. 5H TaxID=1229490 RepID=UPI002303931D|nr:hypothetical protein [Enterococcus sp. 5H]MDA9472432.1 hypothetical protein [Enterococcus sp. 5H]